MNRVSRSIGCLALVVFSATLESSVTRAGQITFADFSSAAVIQDFQGLGDGNSNTPLLFAGDIYQASGNILEHSSKLGPVIGRSGVAIANRPLGQAGFIDISFGQPVARSGLFVGGEFAWAADVQFFDTSNSMLGVVHVVGAGHDSHFAAWQPNVGFINRIRVTDLVNNGHGIIVDDLITEVPEPASIHCFMMVAAVIAWMKRGRPRLGKLYLPPIFGRVEIHDTTQLSGYQDENIGPFRQWPAPSTA